MERCKLQSFIIRKIKLLGLWVFIICFFFGTSFFVQEIMKEREVRSKESKVVQEINIRKTSENQLKTLKQNSKQGEIVSKYTVRETSQQAIHMSDGIKKDEIVTILEWNERWIYWFLITLFHNA